MKHVSESIPAFVSGELDNERRAGVREHLDVCPQCRAEAARAHQLWDQLGTAAKQRPATGSVWPAVRARTLGRAAGGSAWFFGRQPWLRAGLAGAAVAAGLAVGMLAPAGSGEPDAGDGVVADATWLLESSWLSGSSWLTGDQAVGLDDLLLGAEPTDGGNGS
jgi:anti-sigma factor RsiW